MKPSDYDQQVLACNQMHGELDKQLRAAGLEDVSSGAEMMRGKAAKVPSGLTKSDKWLSFTTSGRLGMTRLFFTSNACATQQNLSCGYHLGPKPEGLAKDIPLDKVRKQEDIATYTKDFKELAAEGLEVLKTLSGPETPGI